MWGRNKNGGPITLTDRDTAMFHIVQVFQVYETGNGNDCSDINDADCMVDFALIENVGVEARIAVPSHIHADMWPHFRFSRFSTLKTGNGNEVG